MKVVLEFILTMVLSFVPGIVGVLFSPNGASDLWYNALNKSALTPDGWVFSVVWPLLYALLGVALFLVVRNAKARQFKAPAYSLFLTQMVLNALWSYFFFGLHMTRAALIALVVLVIVSGYMMREFRSFNRWAGYLVWPYILWLIFAMYLNIIIVWLN